MRRDFDSPWKDALDEFLRELLALLFPKIHDAIDWAEPPESLPAELAAESPESEVGGLAADRLYRVRLLGGGELYVVIHLEVHSQADPEFARRMYNYHTRIRAKYGDQVASLAILADDSPTWHPKRFVSDCLGCRIDFRFPTVKLLKFARRLRWLELSPNVIAPFVAAHLESQRTHGRPLDRKAAKWRLMRGLYERGLNSESARKLIRLIDWIIELPPDLAEEFRSELHDYERRNAMPYVTSFERLARDEGKIEGKIEGKAEGKIEGKAEGKIEGKAEGRLEGLHPGLAVALKLKFGPAGSAFAQDLRSVTDPDHLAAVLDAVESAPTIEALRELAQART